SSDIPDSVCGGAIALLSPGQGSQRVGMLAELLVAFPEIQAPLETGRRFAGRMYPGAALTPEARATQQAALTDTRAAQPALGIVDVAMAILLASVGVEGQMFGGHSYGELPALALAGALAFEDLLPLSEARARCILWAAAGAPGSMAAVRAAAAD